MKRNVLAAAMSRALVCALIAPMSLAAAFNTAVAAEAPADASPDPKQLDSVVVQADIAYRNRTDSVAPVLSYDLEYFQRFEPLTVGDMLKRVPSVAFVSDVLEYDGAQLRGLDPGYTQILINGKKVPGAGNDRSFFVDRIPAELVERIEIIRSTSANRSGDAVAGALNIVLRDAYEFDGKYVRLGALRFDDGEVKPTYGAVASGEVGGGRLLGGFNVQGRYNPKVKRSDRFEEPGGDFVDREDQDDTRDGDDYSANLSYTRDIGTGRLSVDGFYVRTDRTETEHSVEYNDPTSTDRDNLLSINDQVEKIRQDNWSLGVEYAFDMAGGRTEFDIDYARFDDDTRSTEEESGFDDEDMPPSFDEREGTRTLTDTRDSEGSFKLSHKRGVGGATMEFGVNYLDKRRDTTLQVSEVDTDEEGAALPPYDEFDRNDSRIDETRVDPYLMFSGTAGALAWEAGLRYETTDVDVAFDDEAASNDYNTLLPSAHLKWDFTGADRLLFSVGRTVRRPNFDQILPLTLEEEFGDNDFTGNPTLDPERAWGVDFGYERRLGARGVFGVNVFYRDVKDLIEIVNTGEPSSTAIGDYEDEVEDFLDENPGATPTTPGYPQFDPDSFVYTARNVGDGSVYGIEFDLSTPLTALGLPDTGLFVNYSWLDSDVKDDFGERRFNNQAKYVYNVGFIQDLPEWGMSFGASYRRQGDAFSRMLAEEVSTHYGGDLEVFIEKRFGDDLSLRLTGSNLLDAHKDEVFHKFDNAADQFDRDYDEFELETESSGRVYQLIMRYSF
ncbi:TonB-dependent receptor plug domain-containing protein [Lysobacter soli]|uniref:TonB-dependent receptor n=1 Tax=Lysobacter soli TaxID=453783 RepID=A0A3D8VC71_9GAMM|nr:TonB-dependent receptor [Lysobacter soli]RDY67014.1 TonB-dependent receptor [Lysobacter soli]